MRLFINYCCPSVKPKIIQTLCQCGVRLITPAPSSLYYHIISSYHTAYLLQYCSMNHGRPSLHVASMSVFCCTNLFCINSRLWDYSLVYKIMVYGSNIYGYQEDHLTGFILCGAAHGFHAETAKSPHRICVNLARHFYSLDDVARYLSHTNTRVLWATLFTLLKSKYTVEQILVRTKSYIGGD